MCVVVSLLKGDYWFHIIMHIHLVIVIIPTASYLLGKDIACTNLVTLINFSLILRRVHRCLRYPGYYHIWYIDVVLRTIIMTNLSTDHTIFPVT